MKKKRKKSKKIKKPTEHVRNNISFPLGQYCINGGYSNMTVMSLSEDKVGGDSCEELRVCGQLVDLCSSAETPALATDCKNRGGKPNP